MNSVMDTTTKGILTPHDIDEEGRYYFVRKAIDAGDVVRFRNKVGMDVMTEVLRAYLSRKDRNIARLTEYARKMRIGTRMTQYLNVMV